MSFSRNQYDKCAYKQNLSQSMNIGNYQFFEYQGIHPSPCRVDFGIVGGNNVNISSSQVDLESDLRGQKKNSSVCSNNKHLPPYLKNKLNNGETIGETNSVDQLPTCKMVEYKPVIYSKPSKGSLCSMYK